MSIKDLYKHSKSESILFADRETLAVFFNDIGYSFITEIYEKIYTTPEIYKYFTKTLDIDSLKIFSERVSEVNFMPNLASIRTIMKDTKILTEDEAYAVLYSVNSDIDILIDDPHKAEVCKDYHVNVIRPTNLIASALKNGGHLLHA